jgi:hypothetical protein
VPVSEIFGGTTLILGVFELGIAIAECIGGRPQFDQAGAPTSCLWRHIGRPFPLPHPELRWLE